MTPITDRDVAAVRTFFRDHGVDPDVIAPEFFLYQLSQGRSAAQIFLIAHGTSYRRSPALDLDTETEADCV